MAASEYGKWIKVAMDLSLGGDELKMFVKERQEEAKLEKARADEAEREARKLELEGKRLLAEAKKLEFEEKKQIAEQEMKKLEFEEKKQIAEREAESRRIAAEQETKKLEFEENKQIAEREQEMKKLELEAKKQEMESQQIIRLKEMEFRLAQEQGDAERQNIIGQGDSRSDHRGDIRDVQMPTYDQSEDLHCYLNRFELTCNTLKISKDLRVLALIKSLKGQALEVHERMKAEDAQDYEKLKVELLKRFRLTEGGYR